MRLIYCGIVHVSSTEIDDFISTAECLKIDGLAAEDPSTSSHEDTRTPTSLDYCSRLSPSESHSPGESGGTGYANSYGGDPPQSFASFSPEDFSRAKDYRYGRGGHSPKSHQSPTQDGEIDHLQSESLLIRCQPRTLGQGDSSEGVRVISSPQSSPGVGIRSGDRESLLKVEVQENYGDSSHFYDSLPRPPSCPEGFRSYSQSTSPIESRGHAIRHPVIARSRDPSSDFTDDSCEVQAPRTGFISPRAVLPIRNSRLSPYPSGWEHHRGLNVAGEAVVMDDLHRTFPTVVISGSRSPIASRIKIAPSTGHGVTTRYPLSVISSQPPVTIPLQQLLSPAGAGFLPRIPPQLHLLTQLNQQHRSQIGDSSSTSGGVITTVPPHSSPQSHDPHQLQSQQSTLAMLRAKISSGQPVYSRGCRSDRQIPHLNNPKLFDLPRFPSHALGSAPPIGPHESLAAGSSRSFIHSSVIAQQHGIARPKTKAIRSSQVPQSARYTAAEVDAMVDKVQNFPGNMVPCAICSKFVKRERLRAHIHECHLLHGKRIVCPHCGIGLKSKGSYRVHIWRHKRGALPANRQRNSDPHHPLPQSQPHPTSRNPH